MRLQGIGETTGASFSFGMTPDPEWQPQDRIEERQPLRQRDSQNVSLAGQMEA